MNTTDPFAAYKMPLGLTSGITIRLRDTPAEFVVVLPGTMNEDFNMSLISRMNAVPNDDGEIHVDASTFSRHRKALFFDTCILGSKGLPSGMDAAEFFEKYPIAARYIFEEASRLATIADTEVNDALGKSETTPNGKDSGLENMINTMPSSSRASRSRHAAPN